MIRVKKISLKPAGSDGSATATGLITVGRPGFIRAVSVAMNGQPTTTDITVKADVSQSIGNAVTGGTTVLTLTNVAADLTHQCVAAPAIEEDGAAAGADDVGAGGFPFERNVYFSVAQADAYVAGDDGTIDVTIWVEV